MKIKQSVCIHIAGNRIPTDDSTIRFTATVCKFTRTGSSSLDFLVLDVWRCNSRRITADLEAMHRIGLVGPI